MKISYNWLKDYLKIDIQSDKVAEILTDIGLEVEGIEEVESVKGGLKGVVIGEVKSVEQHPNADRLKLTKIDVGHADLLDIVCGAPNVAEGQKVVVALVGTILYSDDKGFKIKKSKIRGESSEGMLCAEDELGLGGSHDGIIVLEKEATIGQNAADYYQLSSDTVFEIGLTPNRVDAASHFGVARDLAAYLNIEEEFELKKPSARKANIGSESTAVEVLVENTKDCPRYSALTITNVNVGPSPDWLQNRLKAIGLKPINNIVDITNYVLHELGQPLHAFDLDKITGNKVVIRNAKEGDSFTTLDGAERKLSEQDLMICNEKEGMCIAGVFGGEKSGVTESTTNIFLESAYFNPVSIRKTAKRHALNTDASFRYERGTDPNITVYALKRATQLIQEIAGGSISSEVFDHYPESIEDFLIDFEYENCDRLIGQSIDRKVIKKILQNLEIELLNESKKGLRLKVPAYRVDVQREVDVIEEILRLYGYNSIASPQFMKSAILTNSKLNPTKIENTISDYLSSNGFAEIFTNSLSNPKYYGEKADLVKMLNPLSSELEVLRQSMLYGGLEAIAYNQNRKRKNLKFYEFGRTYVAKGDSQFEETKRLGIWITGDQFQESWQAANKASDVFQLKEFVQNCLLRIGVDKWKAIGVEEESQFSQALEIKKGKINLVILGQLSKQFLNDFGIKEKVYYAEFNWSDVLKVLKVADIQLKPITKFPSIRRDLALLIDAQVNFDRIKEIAKSSNQLLKEVNLFDVYEGDKIAKGKKSYAVSLTFQDENKTLTDSYIDKLMDKIIKGLQEGLGAELR